MQNKPKTGGHILLIPQTDIRPNRNQPRKRFNCDELESLAESIRQNGILQPLIVRRITETEFELVAGERRLRAARIVGIERIPCIVMEISDAKSAVFALTENVQRQNLDFFEESEALVHIMLYYQLSQEELAVKLGKAPSTVCNKLRLLKLPDDVRFAILSAELTERHARALLKLSDPAQMRSVLAQIIEKHLNVTQSEQLIEQTLQKKEPPKKPPIKLFKDVRIFVNTLNHAVDTMRKAGIAADAVKSETETYIEYVVRIPKTAGQIIRTGQSGT